MSRPSPRPLPSGLAVTLISGSDLDASARIGAGLSGTDATARPEELDLPEVDSAEFAVELAARLAADAGDGITGSTAIALEPAADVVEVALVLEHMLNAQRPRVAVGIRDVVAVSSVREIGETLLGMGMGLEAPAPHRDLDAPGRLAQRLEFASLIVLTDDSETDRPAESGLIRALLARLAPDARVLGPSAFASAPPWHGLLVHDRAHRLGAGMGWQRELAGDAPVSGIGGPVGAYVFRDPRPFHPGRLHEAVAERLTPERVGRIARSRGFIRLATRPERVGSWATAGDVLDLDATSLLSWDADSPVGQELVFFGIDLDRDAIEATLASCLLTDAELTAGPESWARLPDPFPEWAVHSH